MTIYILGIGTLALPTLLWKLLVIAVPSYGEQLLRVVVGCSVVFTPVDLELTRCNKGSPGNQPR